MEQLIEDIYTIFPLIIVGQMRDPHHREMLRTMSLYTLSPPPLIIEVDQREDAEILVPLLSRLIDTDVMPQVIVKGYAAADAPKLAALHASGDLELYFQGSGITLSQKIKNKKPKYIRNAERQERRERRRLSRPQPIAIGRAALT